MLGSKATLVWNLQYIILEYDALIWRRLSRDRWNIGGCKRRRFAVAAAARKRVYHLRCREGLAFLQMSPHQLERLQIVEVQRNKTRIEAREGVEGIQVMRVGHFVITHASRASFAQLVLSHVSARGVVRRKNRIGATGDNEGGDAVQMRAHARLGNALHDAIMPLQHRPC